MLGRDSLILPSDCSYLLESTSCNATAKSKDARVTTALECTYCIRKETGQDFLGIHRYTTRKNRRNTSNRLELKKYCPHCCRHTIYRELKK